MAMTAAVKDELSRVETTKTCCRKAEVSTMLRFGGGLHIVSGQIVIEAELDAGATARRLRKDILEIYGHESEIAVVQASGLRKGTRYVVRVVQGGEALARQTGMVDGSGRPVRGLPPAIVAGRLRLEHSQASLEELGALADPPMTKDAIAGRIRRLLALADKRAQDLGIPDTESVLGPEFLG